jgi:hypothetical protein
MKINEEKIGLHKEQVNSSQAFLTPKAGVDYDELAARAPKTDGDE